MHDDKPLTPPFRVQNNADGECQVDDAEGHWACSCRTPELAARVVELLNGAQIRPVTCSPMGEDHGRLR